MRGHRSGLGAAACGLVAAGALVGCGATPAAAPAASGADRGVVVSGAWVGQGSSAQHRPVYLSIADDTGQPVKIVAAVSPVATSVSWVLARHVHTLDEVTDANFDCTSSPAVLAAAAQQMARTGDVYVGAHTTLHLRAGAGRLQLDQPVTALPVGSTVPLTLWFDDGAEIQLRVPVRAGRVTDPVGDPVRPNTGD